MVSPVQYITYDLRRLSIRQLVLIQAVIMARQLKKRKNRDYHLDLMKRTNFDILLPQHPKTLLSLLVALHTYREKRGEVIEPNGPHVVLGADDQFAFKTNQRFKTR